MGRPSACCRTGTRGTEAGGARGRGMEAGGARGRGTEAGGARGTEAGGGGRGHGIRSGRGGGARMRRQPELEPVAARGGAGRTLASGRCVLACVVLLGREIEEDGSVAFGSNMEIGGRVNRSLLHLELAPAGRIIDCPASVPVVYCGQRSTRAATWSRPNFCCLFGLQLPRAGSCWSSSLEPKQTDLSILKRFAIHRPKWKIIFV